VVNWSILLTNGHGSTTRRHLTIIVATLEIEAGGVVYEVEDTEAGAGELAL
jgi:hypothetical protein